LRFLSQGVRVEGVGTGNYFTEMCSGSEVGSYSRLIHFVYHSGLRVIKKRKRNRQRVAVFLKPVGVAVVFCPWCREWGLGVGVEGLGFRV